MAGGDTLKMQFFRSTFANHVGRHLLRENEMKSGFFSRQFLTGFRRTDHVVIGVLQEERIDILEKTVCVFKII